MRVQGVRTRQANGGVVDRQGEGLQEYHQPSDAEDGLAVGQPEPASSTSLQQPRLLMKGEEG